MLQRTFIPGDRWVYFKIYTGFKIADWIIVDELFPIIKRLIKNGLIEKFFFIRYNDPDFHIRLRLLLTNNNDFNNTIDVINKKLKVIVGKQLVWKIQLDTYQREIERYNRFLIEDTESLFYVDSIHIMQIIKRLNKVKNDDYRWMISLLLIDKLLSDFCLTLEQKKNFMTSISNAFKAEFGFDQFNSKQFNEKYRINKSTVESILNDETIDEDYSTLVRLVHQRSSMMKYIVTKIRLTIKLKKLNIQDYIGSYIHMTMNRLFTTDNRLYELIIYDFMKRYYISKIVVTNRIIQEK